MSVGVVTYGCVVEYVRDIHDEYVNLIAYS